jgi:hypothetical protein
MYLRSAFILITWTFSAAGCSNSPQATPLTNDCRAFKNGTFVFRPQGGKTQWSYLITRTDTLQIEEEQPTGGRSVLAVKWLNDCTYQVRLVSSTIAFPDSIQQLRKTIPLTTQILQTTAHYYIFRSQRAPGDAAFIDTLWIHQ